MPEIPWDILLGAAGGAAIPTVLVVIFANRIIDRVVENTFARNLEAYRKQLELVVAQSLETYKNQLELSSDIDTDLRDRRTKVYDILWKKTELLPKWPRAPSVTYEKLSKFSEELRDWYFRDGGMYLSRQAQKSYVNLQETITDILKVKKNGKITDDDYDTIRDKCSALRTELTNDILSRRAAPL